MLKYIICLLILITLNPCFSEPEGLSNIKDSSESKTQEKLSIHTNWDLYNKQEIQDALDYLKTEDQIKKQMEIYDHLSEEDKERAIDKNKRIIYGKWKIVLADPKYNDYVKDIFQKENFALWMAQSPEPLYFAIHNRNIEMVRLFSKPKGIFDQFMKRYTYSPVGVAIIIQDMEIIIFYLDNHLVDMTRKDAQGLHIFHYPFIGFHRKGKQGKILDLLFKKKYFPKISHLLNEPNNTNSTAFDHFLKDDIGKKMNKGIMEQFLDKGAVPLQHVHLFLQQELKDDLDMDRSRKVDSILGIIVHIFVGFYCQEPSVSASYYKNRQYS